MMRMRVVRSRRRSDIAMHHNPCSSLPAPLLPATGAYCLLSPQQPRHVSGEKRGCRPRTPCFHDYDAGMQHVCVCMSVLESGVQTLAMTPSLPRTQHDAERRERQVAMAMLPERGCRRRGKDDSLCSSCLLLLLLCVCVGTKFVASRL